jgi:hypothetical protein
VGKGRVFVCVVTLFFLLGFFWSCGFVGTAGCGPRVWPWGGGWGSVAVRLGAKFRVKNACGLGRMWK